MTTLEDILRRDSLREEYLHALICDVLDDAGELCSTDLVDAWEDDARIGAAPEWYDRRTAFQQTSKLLRRMREAGELVEARRTVSANGGGPARLYLRRAEGGQSAVGRDPHELLTPEEVIAQPKPAPRWESEAYRTHVRAYACCNCGARPPSDAHHLGPRGMGRKADDTRCAPLCRSCHDYWHAHGTLPASDGDPMLRESAIGIQERAQRDCLEAWVQGRRRG